MDILSLSAKTMSASRMSTSSPFNFLETGTTYAYYVHITFYATGKNIASVIFRQSEYLQSCHS